MAQKSITIVQLNDSHAYLEPHAELFWQGSGPVFREAGGYARIAGLLAQIRGEKPGSVLFCDCGDTLHGTYPAVQTRGQAVIPSLNALAPAAMTAHWEFAYTPPVLEEESQQLNFPMLALNVYYQGRRERPFPGSTIVESGGLRVGLIGLASNIVDKTMPPAFSQGLYFSLGREELPGEIERLRVEEHADLIVLISHLGFPQDMQLMAHVPGVDVCLSAHTHHRLAQPVLQGKTLIIQSGSQGSFLGRLDLEVEDGSLSGFQHQLIEVTPDLPADPHVAELVRQAVDPFRAELEPVVGQTAVDLYRGEALQSSMDHFILAALLETTGASLAFSNGWRYGAPVPAGDVRMRDLYNMVPMNPPISTVELTGLELREMIEENLEHTFARDPFRQMGGYVKRALGIKVYFKIENPFGQRVQQIFVGDEEVRPGETYSTAFITAQGVPEKYGQNRQDTSERIVPAMRAYLERHSPFTRGETGAFTPI
ncbi:MAG TPA: bifunctional metallophosphatase/5'-nucleotidase [Anaerolineaceae bacterium]|nr:bifunctional metallophosphatase/5'-nucleotidase [Anaerolineaceae bacterium]